MNNQDRVVIEFMIYFSVSSFFNLNGSILGFRSLALFCHNALSSVSYSMHSPGSPLADKKKKQEPSKYFIL